MTYVNIYHAIQGIGLLAKWGHSLSIGTLAHMGRGTLAWYRSTSKGTSLGVTTLYKFPIE